MIKTKTFDKFICLADKCEMTCCKGWSVRVEHEDMEKWKASEETAYLCQETSDGQMKLDFGKSCILLDKKGLCEIVKRHGDTALAKTCSEFPRKCNKIYETSDDNEEKAIWEEYALTGACPAALWLADEEKHAKIVEIPDLREQGTEFAVQWPLEYRMRNMLLLFLQETKFTLEEKLMLCFDFLHECLACEWESEADDCMEVYTDVENQEEHVALYQNMQYKKEDALYELCQTFFDVTEFYKEEEMYAPYLTGLFDFVKTMETADYVDAWQQFKTEFSKQDDFFIKAMASEIFSDCISDDLEILIESFQSIVMEYAMTRISVFLKKQLGKEIQKQDVITYMSLYIRMIGHNVDGMAEYWEENFDDPILEKEYLYLLLK